MISCTNEFYIFSGLLPLSSTVFPPPLVPEPPTYTFYSDLFKGVKSKS